MQENLPHLQVPLMTVHLFSIDSDTTSRWILLLGTKASCCHLTEIFPLGAGRLWSWWRAGNRIWFFSDTNLDAAGQEQFCPFFFYSQMFPLEKNIYMEFWNCNSKISCVFLGNVSEAGSFSSLTVLVLAFRFSPDCRAEIMQPLVLSESYGPVSFLMLSAALLHH